MIRNSGHDFKDRFCAPNEKKSTDLNAFTHLRPLMDRFGNNVTFARPEFRTGCKDKPKFLCSLISIILSFKRQF